MSRSDCFVQDVRDVGGHLHDLAPTPGDGDLFPVDLEGLNGAAPVVDWRQPGDPGSILSPERLDRQRRRWDFLDLADFAEGVVGRILNRDGLGRGLERQKEDEESCKQGLVHGITHHAGRKRDEAAAALGGFSWTPRRPRWELPNRLWRKGRWIKAGQS